MPYMISTRERKQLYMNINNWYNESQLRVNEINDIFIGKSLTLMCLNPGHPVMILDLKMLIDNSELDIMVKVLQLNRSRNQ